MDGVSERNKRKVCLFVEAVWNEGRLELIDDLIADDYVGRVPCLESRVLGPQGMRRLVAERRRAHPDLHVKIEDQIAEDDRVATLLGRPARQRPRAVLRRHLDRPAPGREAGRLADPVHGP